MKKSKKNLIWIFIYILVLTFILISVKTKTPIALPACVSTMCFGFCAGVSFCEYIFQKSKGE